VDKPDRSLTSEFNGELSGAVICAVEETDIAKSPGAHAKIKEYSTGRTILIRRMRHDCFAQPNATHWVQTANRRENCPIFPGDTRITMISVNALLKAQKIAKPTMEDFLDQEGAHFLHTLMHLELPPMIDRLRLPVVATGSKQQAEEDNRTYLEQFIAECCEPKPDEKAPFAAFYDRFQQWLPAGEKFSWPRRRVAIELPVQHKTVSGTDHAKFIPHLALKPAEKEKP